MRLKIGIFLGSRFHARSLIESDVLFQLQSDNEIIIFTTDDIVQHYSQHLSRVKVHSIIVNSEQNKYFAKHLKLGTLRYLFRSRSFRFRVKRTIVGDYYPEYTLKGILNWAYAVSIAGLKILINYIISITPYYFLVQKLYIKSVLKIASSEMFEKYSFDVIIGWSQTSEPTAIAAVSLGKKYSIPSLLVIDNWDNLSSKSIFPIEPNGLVCFGPQSAEFTKSIHRFNNSKIFPIGSARFEIYRNQIDNQDYWARKEILFAGSALAMEDNEILDVLNNYAMESPHNLIIKYRRHPYPQGVVDDLTSIRARYANLIIDDSTTKNSTLQSLKATASTLEKVQVMISMPTTFLLEGLLCQIPTIIISFASKRVRTSSNLMLEKLEHLQGIKDLVGDNLVHNTEELWTRLDKILKQDQQQKTSEHLKYYITWSPLNFAEQLINSIREIIFDFKKQ